jgi:hypothetical protein
MTINWFIVCFVAAIVNFWVGVICPEHRNAYGICGWAMAAIAFSLLAWL